jgi:hypothetical protein
MAILFGASGCELGGGAPPPEGILAIENVAKWYQLYRASHRGKPPKDEDAFIAFIEKDLAARGSEILDREQFLTSPRDGQKYIIQYGKANSKNIERNVAVYEQEGYRDKKLLAFEAAWSREVDDAELQSLLAEK